jgi:hypothetical protein
MLSVKSLSFAFAILWAAAVFGVGILNLLWPGYGVAFLDMVKSIYPGYAAVSGFGGVIVGTLYALVDGAVGGAVFAWLYNVMRAEKPSGAGAGAMDAPSQSGGPHTP